MEPLKSFILTILDGFGVSLEHEGNPVAMARTPVLDELAHWYPFTALQASGVAVGLPWGGPGNSEVGHLTMGAGRVVYHHLPRIIHAIADGSFFENPALKDASSHLRRSNGRLHIAGLVSSGSVHSYVDHLMALLEFAKREELGEVLIHAFTDGKDAPIKDGAAFIAGLEKRMAQDFPAARFASVVGRFYAMDRDAQWDRVRQAYELMTQGKGVAIASIPAYLQACYEQGETDEFIPPAVVVTRNQLPVTVGAGDALIFFNFREDSMREITRAFVEDGFDKFARQKLSDLFVATMTEYEKGLSGVAALFPTLPITHPFGGVVSDAGLRQLRIAETEKYAHVTYFFNGGEEAPYAQEERILVPSLPMAHFDDASQMRAADIASTVVENIDNYAVIVANFANADMIGHSGNFKAAVAAVEALDEALGVLVNAVMNKKGTMIITADHGNVELKRNAVSGEKISKHSINPVPFFVVGEQFRRATARSDEEIAKAKSEVGGILTDVAPTALALLGLEKPAEMTGQNLLAMLLTQIR